MDTLNLWSSVKANFQNQTETLGPYAYQFKQLVSIASSSHTINLWPSVQANLQNQTETSDHMHDHLTLPIQTTCLNCPIITYYQSMTKCSSKPSKLDRNLGPYAWPPHLTNSNELSQLPRLLYTQSMNKCALQLFWLLNDLLVSGICLEASDDARSIAKLLFFCQFQFCSKWLQSGTVPRCLERASVTFDFLHDLETVWERYIECLRKLL
jgi:hypothetical protein